MCSNLFHPIRLFLCSLLSWVTLCIRWLLLYHIWVGMKCSHMLLNWSGVLERIDNNLLLVCLVSVGIWFLKSQAKMCTTRHWKWSFGDHNWHWGYHPNECMYNFQFHYHLHSWIIIIIMMAFVRDSHLHFPCVLEYLILVINFFIFFIYILKKGVQ
jgi:hypothetical protein